MSVCRSCAPVSIVLVTGLAQEAIRRMLFFARQEKAPAVSPGLAFTDGRKLIHMLSELVVDSERDHVEVARQGYGIVDK